MSDDNINNRLKDIIEQLQNKMEDDYDKKLSKDKDEIINNLINMFPHLESKKNEIIQECANAKQGTESTKTVEVKTDQINKRIDEMVFDEIEFKGKKYYLNQYNGVWDSRAELVGSLIGYDSDNNPLISFFDSKIQKDIPADLKKIFYKQ